MCTNIASIKVQYFIKFISIFFISEFFELIKPVTLIPQDTYFKREGLLELKYSVRNVAGENFTAELEDGSQKLSILELKVSIQLSAGSFVPKMKKNVQGIE